MEVTFKFTTTTPLLYDKGEIDSKHPSREM